MKEKFNLINNMDLSIPGSTTAPLSTPSVFGDNVQDLLGTGALQVHPSATIVVNSIDDVLNSSLGVTTLRDAINKANADTGKDLIVFDRLLFSSQQTITLKLGELNITHSLDIIAPQDTLTGGDLVTVSGNKASRVFQIEGFTTVNLSGLIVADGSVEGDNGGGIKNSGTLTVENSIVRNNSVTFGSSTTTGSGGGIYNSGSSTINNSTISGNSASDDGAGIENDGALKVNSSIISGNSSSYQGGGIYNNVGISTINKSTISGNSALNGGGGIGYAFTSTIDNNMVNNSTISGNSADFGGGIQNSAIVTVNKSTISSNSATDGGGIENDGTLEVNNSTISDNSASDGGGISSIATLKVNNSTISKNSATNAGGGIDSSGNLEINNSTISSNSTTFGGGIYNSFIITVNNSTISSNSGSSLGGGIYNDYFGSLTLLFSTVTQNQAANGGGVYQNHVPPFSTAVRGSNSVRNTIIAANLNSTGGVNPDVEGTFTSNGYNLIGSRKGSTGFGVTGDIVGTTAKPIDPHLGVLASNGGPTQTIALLTGSPAINAGDPTVLPTDPTKDQRGKPRVQRGRADIGAFESSLNK